MLILRILVGGILCLGLVACGEKQVRREGILLPYSEAAQLELQDVRKKYEGKDTPQFIQALNKFIEDYPDTSATTEAETLLAALEPKSAEPQPLPIVSETKKHVIGCVLPLSGKYASYGMKSLRGIEQALQFFEEGSQTQPSMPFELAIYDSKGSPQEAAQGVSYLVEHHGVMAIMGPILTNESVEAAARAQQLQVPLLNLSQHPTITETGEYVFRNAMTKQHQTDALIDYACKQQGLRKFVILYPQDSYGIEFANQFWDKVEECGGTVEGVEAYEPDQSDFNQEVKKFIGLHQPRAREEEYHLEEEKLKIELNKEEIPEAQVKLPSQIDFEAIFIPDYAKTIGQIAPTLAYYDVQNVTLLGTQGWNSPDLIRRGQEYVTGAVFVDGFFSKSPEPSIREFVKKFENTFGEPPELWEAQAYDAAYLLVSLLQEEEVLTREDLKNRLLSLSHISGVTGEASLSETHDVKKKLFLLTVQQGEIIPLGGSF